MNELLFWLTAIGLLTSLLWIPYILNAFFLNGILTTMQYPAELFLSDWARRAKKAHLNAIENLAVFSLLAIPALFLIKNSTIDLAFLILTTKIYFSARVFHYIFYLFKIPYLRTLCFLIGFSSQVAFAVEIFSALQKP